MPSPRAPLLLLGLLAPATPVRSQTSVGCDASCPPRGYEDAGAHLCPGASVDAATASRVRAVCHPAAAGPHSEGLRLEDFRGSGRVTVLANYYTGCAAGRREAGVFAGIAQRIHDDTGGRVHFVTSLKGGGNCATWAGIYQSDALSLGLNNGVRPSTMPLTVSDDDNDLRDRFFTPPYPHPSYIILDENLEVTHKTVGPCCGYVSYYDCTDDVASGLDGMLTDAIYAVYDRQAANVFGGDSEPQPENGAPQPESTENDISDNGNTNNAAADVSDSNVIDIIEGGDNDSDNVDEEGVCQEEAFSEWSACSKTCGDGGVRFRFRANADRPVERRPCPAEATAALPACADQCVPELGGRAPALTVVAAGLRSPRDLAFHPTPGVHLGVASEGRTFNPLEGEELWVANGANHSVSIVAALGTPDQTTMSRRDRGYYHYMNNVTALAFNAVGDAPRDPDQDTFNYFAVCNDNLNDYVGSKEPNYFMGPTLYDTNTVQKPGRKNTVTRAGEDCADPADECFFLHADMLHEAPACLGIAHDPEVRTAYGAVYWAFDATGDNAGDGGQLVRFDFSQPHGPGSMDHSIATVRRYPEVRLRRAAAGRAAGQGHHAGMVVHPETRVLYVANPGEGTVLAVHIDTGRYSRTAREEYPIFSNRLPSFEYSIYECVEQQVFAAGLDSPTGLALSRDGTTLFVAESSGRVRAYETEGGAALGVVDLASRGYAAVGGLAVSPLTGHLYFVDMDANEVARIDDGAAGDCAPRSRSNADFLAAVETARARVEGECNVPFSLTRNYSCEVDGTIPNGTLFEQVHTNTGYASDNPDVQAMAGMDAAAALLANRTDCEYDSELNLDALLLGGYYCHACLPRDRGASCDAGGTCANVQWEGFTCDNEYYVDLNDEDPAAPSLAISSLHYGTTHPGDAAPSLSRGVTYRFTVRTGFGHPVSVGPPKLSLLAEARHIPSPSDGVSQGPLLLTVDDATPDCLHLTAPGVEAVALAVMGTPGCPPRVEVGRDGEDQGGWFVAPDTAAAARSVLSAGGWCSVLAITWHVANLCI